MARRDLGRFLLGVGAVLITVGLGASQLGGEQNAAEPVGGTTEAVGAAAVVTTAGSTSAVAVATSQATTSVPTTAQSTTQAPTSITTSSTTTSTTTTTTLPPESAVAEFITAFGVAINDADVDWLLERLHPAMILGYTEDVCRGFIQDDILLLQDYALRGSITGPVAKTLETGVGSITVEGIYAAEISFAFQGETVNASADFVPGEQTTWLAICR